MLQRLFLYCFLQLFLLHASAITVNDGAHKLNEYLAHEKISLTADINQAKLLSTTTGLMDSFGLTQRQQQNTSMQALINAKIVGLNDFLANQIKQQQNLNRRLKRLQELPLDKLQSMPTIEERTNILNARKTENDQTIQLIRENIVLAQAYQAILIAERYQLDLLQANVAEQQQIAQLSQKIHALKAERDALYQTNINVLQNKVPTISLSARMNHEALLLLNSQAIVLVQHKIADLSLQKKRVAADYLLLQNQDVKTIELAEDVYKLSVKQLFVIERSLNKMLELLKNERTLLSSDKLKRHFSNVQQSVERYLKQVINQQQNLQKELAKKQEQLKKQLASRQSLAEYHLNSWPTITSQLLQIPEQFYNYTRLLVFKVCDNYLRKDSWSVAFVLISLGVILIFAAALGRVLHQVVQGKERSSMSGHLYDGALLLLYRNMFHLTVVAMLITVFLLTNVAFANYQLLINLFLVWLTFRNLILIARLTLLERISDASGKDVKLYYRLQWLLLVGGWSTALMVFGHQLPLSLLLQDIFNRVFMLFLLAVSVVAWKSKDIIPYLLRPLLKAKKRYLRKAVSLLVVLVPLTLLTTAMIGLIGYIDLAWTMSRYQAYLVLVITSYVLMRGVFLDALEFVSKWMIGSLHNGWLWVEVILKPLDAIVRVCLVLLAIMVLFQLFGWSADSQVVAVLWQIGQYPFINLSGAHITLFSVLAFVALLFVFMWFAKWTREFCYRWLYRNINDSGIRNSLSVFTQYAVILSGGLLTLRVLGIDFTGMAIVFGGLAVGMGFGLRDFASNIVGGVMLLIERPVREGDLITLGEYEGRVAHIGIRTMRVSSWDNMEVLIPNAETFNKPFTNWTHQDSIVRTVVPIKVNRADDPTMVQQLILDVLVIIPEVLDEPPPQVLLKQIDEVLIDFEIRYFINVQLHTRFEVRSTVLFAIMAQFKAAGVRAPIPSLNIEMNEPLEHDDASKPSSTE